MFLYQIIGWIIVLAFAITFVISILSLIGKVQIEDVYKRKLFNALILEIISAGFFLFYQGMKGKPEVYSIPDEIYAFSPAGEPVQLRIVSGDSSHLVKKFPMLADNTFKNVLRGAVIEQNKLYFTTSDQKIYLGYLEDVKNQFGDQLLSSQTALFLGQHLSEMVNGNRRAPYLAVKYLFKVLQDETGNQEEKAIAVQRLVFLLKYINTPEAYDRLVQSLHKYRAEDYNRYFDLAETHLEYAKLASLSPTDKVSKRKEALKYYLLFLATPESLDRDLSKQKKNAKDRSKELLGLLSLLDREIRRIAPDLQNAIKKHDRNRLRQFIQLLSAPDVTNR